ncbi:hypothetical protein HELRODRAFT_151948, partial [Helobdella robusta]|uniref:MORN repeat-containing protein 4 n=1 Tax=Helobdella robusta TaxID=6412 RepID=T1EKN2_HELRO
MGSWSEDNKHGGGVVVTLDGYYFEGNFNSGKMIGKGLLMTEDNHVYEGEFSGFSFAGKGVLTLPNGDALEGSFGGNFVEGVKVTGVLKKSTEHKEPNINATVSFGMLTYPAHEKWLELFNQCYSALGCSN